MNRSILIGRLTDEPKINNYTNGNVAHYTLAVDRKSKDKETDFINIVAFGKAADFADKYFRKGMRVAVEGRIQTGSYVNKDGNKVNTFEVVADSQEFADGKKTEKSNGDGWMNVPDDEIPF